MDGPTRPPAEPDSLTGRRGASILPHGGMEMVEDQVLARARARLRRIEGQVQGLQRMIAADVSCADVLLQISAVQGALTQVQKILLGRHLESCVVDALRSGSKIDRQRKLDELLDVFTRFGAR
jgi:CsoR family transcriptional regulator, copper-sensing transcriptional repressor